MFDFTESHLNSLPTDKLRHALLAGLLKTENSAVIENYIRAMRESAKLYEQNGQKVSPQIQRQLSEL